MPSHLFSPGIFGGKEIFYGLHCYFFNINKIYGAMRLKGVQKCPAVL